ncbi:flagellar motor switch protein FliN [Dorea sp. D27]|uniref:flagellar motor switch protein FliN n=1 Tax=Dorea sp. D27 TaxID=658665 RepID=UPI0006739DCD|nr:flagellar motor switch protein FliN [Dorea sp. D27]KMZ54318.1 CheC, inhibitor of MCP methylation [Dorea sp. D27]
MDIKKLSSMEIDAIGEILNISLGASATAISTMLDARVDITTPIVQVRDKDEFEFGNLEPAIGVEIIYIEGLTGSNIMLLKRNDVRVIVEMLMGMEIPEEDFELDEMNISAICEVMNQMMGASATALSELLGKAVNISTPVSFEIESPEQFKEKYFTEESPMVVIGFTLRIADKMESEFMNLMPIGLAKELVAGFFSDGIPDAPEEEAPAPVEEALPEPEVPAGTADTAAPVGETLQNAAAPPGEIPQSVATATPPGEIPQSVATATPPVMPQAVPSAAAAAEQAAPPVNTVQPPDYAAGAVDPQFMNSMTQMMEMMRQQMEMQQLQLQQMQQAQAAGPKKIKVNPVPQPNLEHGADDTELQDSNLELIMGVPLEVSVEIGRTKKLVKDVLELNKGSLVVLDKLAGEQVDLFVNGQCIAQGDVVVVDDNFGIRITEILADEIPLAQ